MSNVRRCFEAFVVGAGSAAMAVMSGVLLVVSLIITFDDTIITFDDVIRLFRKED